MGGDRVPGPLSRFIPPLDEFLRARLKALATGNPNGDDVPGLLLRARASYVAEFHSLNEIALAVLEGHRRSFLRKYADAWLHADPYDKRLMLPVFQALIRKYGLEGEAAG